MTIKWHITKGSTLSFEDISHYQKIIKALVETDRIMRGIDEKIKNGASNNGC